MVRLANQIDVDVMAEFYRIPNWVGQPATGADAPISSFAMFARGAERLDQMACRKTCARAVLAPESYWAMATSQTGLFLPQIGQAAYRRGEIGEIGGVATYMSAKRADLSRHCGQRRRGHRHRRTVHDLCGGEDTEAVPGIMSW